MSAVSGVNVGWPPGSYGSASPSGGWPPAAPQPGYDSLDSVSFGVWAPPPPQPATGLGSRFIDMVRQLGEKLFGPSQPVVQAGAWRNPECFFISQYRSDSNAREDVAGNGNCGPTSLTMVAKAFNRVAGTPISADNDIERTRKAMTGTCNEHKGTSFAQLQRGAEHYGLKARVVGGSLSALQKELNAGRLPICLVSPCKFRNSRSTGHYVVVTKIDSQGVHCNDPAIKSGPIVIPSAGFMRGWKARGAGAVSVGA